MQHQSSGSVEHQEFSVWLPSVTFQHQQLFRSCFSIRSFSYRLPLLTEVNPQFWSWRAEQHEWICPSSPRPTSPVFLLISRRALCNVRHLRDYFTPWKERFLSNNSNSSKSTLICHLLVLSAFSFSLIMRWCVPPSLCGQWTAVAGVLPCGCCAVRALTLSCWRMCLFLG